MTMDSTRVNVPLRVGGKKMRKRKELDALAGGKRCKRNGSASGEQQLLSDSSDEEVWTRSGRSRYLLRRRTCASMLRACTALLVLACVLATTTVMWLFIDVREQATFLRSQLDQGLQLHRMLIIPCTGAEQLPFTHPQSSVEIAHAGYSAVAGNQGVPDALQKCHSISRELQKNQTALFNSLTQLSQQLTNFSSQVAVVNSGLNKVEEQLKASPPELVNVASLSNSVATFGSQIRDLVLTTDHLKEYNKNLVETTNNLQQNITSLKQKVSALETAPPGIPTLIPDNDALSSLTATVNSIRTNLTNINSTLSEKVQWALDDEIRDKKDIQKLQDSSASITAKVTTLRDECNAKTSQITNLSDTVEHYNSQLDTRVSDLNNHLADVEGKCSRLLNNTTSIENSINNIKARLNLEFSEKGVTPSEKPKHSENVTEV